MTDTQLFDENLERFARFWPIAAIELEHLECPQLEFCQTKHGELNLRKSVGNEYIYYHSQDGARAEAEQWLNELNPLGLKILFVYGLGLGYYYDVLEEWLSFDPGRYLIFIEDDLCVVRKFLETEKAAKILQNSQVIVHYFPTPGERDWGKFRHSFYTYFVAFSTLPYQISALKLYKEEYLTMFNLISNQISYNLLQNSYYYREMIGYCEGHAVNLYENLTSLPDAYQGDHLFDKFKNVPTIICGAGPSLAKQLPELKKLYNRAIIWGSGSGMNILNRNGIMPHFGACIDPDITQESRFITNYAYEVNFFYVSRFFSKAVKLIHGPKLFFGDDTEKSASWFYKELGLTCYTNIVKGMSTSNLCNRIAGQLQCDPYIFIGMDLAYTESKRYSAGVSAHPADKRGHHEKIEFRDPKSFPATGYDGETVYTKWDWVLEASDITKFSQKNTEKRVINATEGGMKILEVPNLSFKETIDSFLTRSYDIQNWIHAEIQQSYSHGLTHEKVLQAMDKWGESLEKSSNIVQEILDKLIPLRDQFISGAAVSISPLPGKVALLQTDLESEIVYDNYISAYDKVFASFARPELNKMLFFPEQFDEKRRQLWHLHHTIGRYQFLKHYIDIHNRIIKQTIENFKKRLEEDKEDRTIEAIPDQPAIGPEDVYEFSNGKLVIRDRELDIDFEEEFKPEMIPEERKTSEAGAAHEFFTAHPGKVEGQSLLLYPDGKIEGEMFYLNGLLHGPTSFYHNDGQLLARSWFLNDKRVGKSWQYYPDGKVYSLMKYKEGLLHGRQEYYYPNGALKTILNYNQGVLDGEVWLYFHSGKPKRLLHFRNGMLDGKECMWNKKGLLVLEAEFKQNLPAGTSRTWHDNGRLSKEIIFHEDPQNFELFMWNEQGTLIKKQISIPKKPFDSLLQKSNELKELLETATSKITDLKEKLEKKEKNKEMEKDQKT